MVFLRPTQLAEWSLPTELFDDYGETMGRVGNEFGATTGRSRRCGWLDEGFKYAIKINGVTQLMMMKEMYFLALIKSKLVLLTKQQQAYKTIFLLTSQMSKLNDREELAGWEEDLTKMTAETEFPQFYSLYKLFGKRPRNPH